MSESFDDLRPHILDYLYDRGIDPKKRFRCLNPDHLDRDPSMGYDPHRFKVHCFACQADYDLFDLLMLDNDLSSPGEALRLARERWSNDSAPLRRTEGNHSFVSSVPEIEQPTETEPLADRTSYVSECAEKVGETPYFAQRGLSPETVRRFHLGYDPTQACVVLPCDENHIVRRSVSKKRYLNEKGQPSPLFQSELLTGDRSAGKGETTSVIFLLEGTFDALSAWELGFDACALNGSGNREKAAALLRTRSKPAPIALIPDNDSAGDAWAVALTAEFPWLYRCEPVPVGKDLNESLVSNREATLRYLTEQSAACLAQLPPPYTEQSAAGRMKALDRYIAEQALRPPLKTGFPSLDQALDGGLYDGLYVLGAVSSLGKTAFCMQMADQLAAQGRDVLIFSLEMTAFELMARSISRESFLSDTSARRRMAKTVRGVLDGRRYGSYSQQESVHLAAAKTAYAAYADHLWFREGDHETGLDYIEKEIARHIAETGNTPVILIDYLQIIAPVDVHFTDKQNLDRIVCALKKMTRTYSATIFAISSFNRENYNLEVSMSAFKESGGIDYSADVLMGLQAKGAGSRSFNIDEEKRKDPRELELKILKNRSAALGESVPFRYYPAFSCFQEG